MPSRSRGCRWRYPTERKEDKIQCFIHFNLLHGLLTAAFDLQQKLSAGQTLLGKVHRTRSVERRNLTMRSHSYLGLRI